MSSSSCSTSYSSVFHRLPRARTRIRPFHNDPRTVSKPMDAIYLQCSFGLMGLGEGACGRAQEQGLPVAKRGQKLWMYRALRRV